MSEIKLSIIVPIYNAENTLDRCINSIIEQSFSDFELILVNDGSNDKSSEICEKYCKNDKRIKVINKENGGVSSSRNMGIRLSSGEYIIFIDSDDYIESNMCEKMIETIEYDKSDMVICGYLWDKNGVRLNKRLINKLVDYYEFKDEFIYVYSNEFLNQPWNKIYRKSKIIKEFDENKSLGEDLYFNIDYLVGIKKISLIEDTLYYYEDDNKNSLSKAMKLNEEEFINLYKYMIDNYLYVFPEKLPEFYMVFFLHVIRKIEAIISYDKKSRYKNIRRFISNRNVQKFISSIQTNNLKVKILRRIFLNKQILMILNLINVKKVVKLLKNK